MSWTAPMVIVALIVVLYLVFRIVWHPDFGMPVRRRIFCTGVRVDKEGVAYVPLWWSNAQVLRALRHRQSTIPLNQESRRKSDGP